MKVNTVVENMHYPAELPPKPVSVYSYARWIIYSRVSMKRIKCSHVPTLLMDNELIEVCVGQATVRRYTIMPPVVLVKPVNLEAWYSQYQYGRWSLRSLPYAKNAYKRIPCYVDELPENGSGDGEEDPTLCPCKPGKGLRASYMTAFPAPVLQAQSWNIELVERIGHAIGRKCWNRVSLWLAQDLTFIVILFVAKL